MNNMRSNSKDKDNIVSNSFTRRMQSMNQSNITKPACILAHGRYTMDDNKEFRVPENIILIQYTQPGIVLGVIDALHIMKNYNKNFENLQPSYLKNKKTGEIYKPEGKLSEYKGGEVVLDLDLLFEKHLLNESFDERLKMRVINPDDSTEFEGQYKLLLLSTLLASMSSSYNTKYPGKIVPVFQVSCRVDPNVYETDLCSKETYQFDKRFEQKDGAFINMNELTKKFELTSLAEYKHTACILREYSKKDYKGL